MAVPLAPPTPCLRLDDARRIPAAPAVEVPAVAAKSEPLSEEAAAEVAEAEAEAVAEVVEVTEIGSVVRSLAAPRAVQRCTSWGKKALLCSIYSICYDVL